MKDLYKIESYEIDSQTGEVTSAHLKLIDQAVATPPPGKRRIPFHTRCFIHPNGCIEKKIFVDNVEMDYSIDISSFKEAVKMGPAFRMAVYQDIEKHFTQCVSDVVGRHLTLDDVRKAIKVGYIELDE
jgi:hypothetical protein